MEPLAMEGEAVTRALVDNHRRFLAFLERRVGSQAVAEELLQAAYVRTLEKGGALRDGESAVAWFYRLLRNALIDHYRKQAAEGRALEREAREATEAGAGSGAEDRPSAPAWASCCPHSSPSTPSCCGRWTWRSAACPRWPRRPASPPNNAGVRLHRARQALKRQLERSCGTCATHGCLDCSCQAHRKPQA